MNSPVNSRRRRFDLVVRLPEHLRVDIDAISALPIALPPSEGQARTVKAAMSSSTLQEVRYVPFSAVASVETAPGPNQISREDGKRRIVVSTNVRERDLGSFVAETQRAVAEKVKLPAGYWIG